MKNTEKECKQNGDDYVVVRNMYGAPYVVRKDSLPQRTFLDNLHPLLKIAVCVLTWLFFRHWFMPILSWLGIIDK